MKIISKMFFVSLIFILIACNGQENKTISTDKSTTNSTKIDNKIREKFDFDVYQKSLENDGIYILPNKNTVYMISPPNPDYEKQKEDSIKNGSPSHFWEGDGSGFQYERLPKPSFETIYKEFGADGYIIKKEHFIRQNTKVGVSEYFDKNGNVKTIEEDKKFGKIKPIDALKFLETKGILNLKTGEVQQTTSDEDKFGLSFIEEKGHKYFVIVIKEGKSYDGPIGRGEPPAGSSIAYYMDGETGVVTSKK